jgi:hypothetical protein
MKKLIHYAIHQPLFIVLGTLLFVMAGVIAFKNLSVEAFPDVTDTQVTVISLYPGRAAEEVEKQVTLPIEVALAGLPADERLDGVNLIPHLTSEVSHPPHAALYWRFLNQAAVRSGKWKYIQAGNEANYLFDLTSAEHEKNNLINYLKIKSCSLMSARSLRWAKKRNYKNFVFFFFFLVIGEGSQRQLLKYNN